MTQIAFPLGIGSTPIPLNTLVTLAPQAYRGLEDWAHSSEPGGAYERLRGDFGRLGIPAQYYPESMRQLACAYSMGLSFEKLRQLTSSRWSISRIFERFSEPKESYISGESGLEYFRCYFLTTDHTPSQFLEFISIEYPYTIKMLDELGANHDQKYRISKSLIQVGNYGRLSIHLGVLNFILDMKGTNEQKLNVLLLASERSIYPFCPFTSSTISAYSEKWSFGSPKNRMSAEFLAKFLEIHPGRNLDRPIFGAKRDYDELPFTWDAMPSDWSDEEKFESIVFFIKIGGQTGRIFQATYNLTQTMHTLTAAGQEKESIMRYLRSPEAIDRIVNAEPEIVYTS